MQARALIAAALVLLAAVSAAAAHLAPLAWFELARDADVEALSTRSFFLAQSANSPDSRARFSAARAARYASDADEAMAVLTTLAADADPWVAEEAQLSARELVRLDRISGQVDRAACARWAAAWQSFGAQQGRADRAELATWIAEALRQRCGEAP